MSGTWRDIAASIIVKVVRDNKDVDDKELRKKIREAYPFGPREMWPYKVWLSEINNQIGKRRTLKDDAQCDLFEAR